MAHKLIVENIIVNLQANAFGKLCNNGYLRIKTKDNILLAELRFSIPAFNLSMNGILTANEIKPELSAKNTGIAFKYEIYKKDGITKLLTGTVGLKGKGYNLELPNVNITQGSEIHIISFTHEVLKR